MNKIRNITWLRRLCIIGFVLFISIYSFTLRFPNEIENYVKMTFSNYENNNALNNSSYIGRIAIFGASGNIGSYLTLHLIAAGFEVAAYDMKPTLHSPKSTKLHSSSIDAQHLEKFEFVVFLGGCTGRRACAELDADQRHKVNVKDVIDIVLKMNPTQHFIVASTSAVSEGRQNSKESDPIFSEKLDEYSSSMYERELALKSLLAKNDKTQFPRISMLRFGTVVGVSPGQRTDLLVPSLYKAAYKTGVLKIDNFQCNGAMMLNPICA